MMPRRSSAESCSGSGHEARRSPIARSISSWIAAVCDRLVDTCSKDSGVIALLGTSNLAHRKSRIIIRGMGVRTSRAHLRNDVSSWPSSAGGRSDLGSVKSSVGTVNRDSHQRGVAGYPFPAVLEVIRGQSLIWLPSLASPNSAATRGQVPDPPLSWRLPVRKLESTYTDRVDSVTIRIPFFTTSKGRVT